MVKDLLKGLDISITNLAVRGVALINLVESLPEPAHIKDAKTGKYICSNESNLDVYGLDSVSKIIGKTVHDLDGFMQPYWGDVFAKRIDSLDHHVCKHRDVIQEKDRVFIARSGLIHIQDMTKVPVFDEQKVAAIFTHSHDKTTDMDLLGLFDIYQKIYDSKLEARQHFCRYLKIDSFFHEIPSIAEIRVLLYAGLYRHINEIANQMNRSKRSVETHITHINTKIKNNGMNYNGIVEFITISRKPSLKLLEEDN